MYIQISTITLKIRKDKLVFFTLLSSFPNYFLYHNVMQLLSIHVLYVILGVGINLFASKLLFIERKWYNIFNSKATIVHNLLLFFWQNMWNVLEKAKKLIPRLHI